MKEQKTLKINSQVTQFAWDNHVLYLQADEYESGKRKYYIRDVLEPTLIFIDKTESVESDADVTTPVYCTSIDLPISGKLELKYTSSNLKKHVDIDKKLISRNIEFLQCVGRIIEHIEEIENAKPKKDI